MTKQTRSAKCDLGQALDITIEHHRSLADSMGDIHDWIVTAGAADLDSVDVDPPSSPYVDWN